MKKIVLISLICLFCFMTITGCAVQEEPVVEEADKSEKAIQIGMSFDSFVIERWQKDREVFVTEAKARGAEVNVQNANGDLAEQVAQIEYLIDKKVDVLVIIAIDSEGLSGVVAKAKEAGIKVVAYDRLIKNADVDLYISFDNEQVGTLMGEAIASCELPNRKVLMLAGPTSDNNVSMIERGFRNVMAANELEIVDIMHAEGWKAELASEYINRNLSKLDEVDAIMCGNDMIATNVIRTLAENRLAGKIKIVGQDAELEACQRIVEGTQVMTVYKPVEKLAQKAAEYACLLARGRELSVSDGDVKYQMMSDGTYEVPAIVLEPISVNADNMKEVIIDSGFHFEEDVYLNVKR